METPTQDSTRKTIAIGVIVAAILVSLLQLVLLLFFPWVIEVEILVTGAEVARHAPNPWIIWLGIMELLLALLWWFWLRGFAPIQHGWAMMGSVMAALAVVIITFCLPRPVPAPDPRQQSLQNAINSAIQKELETPSIRRDLEHDELPTMRVETLRVTPQPEIIKYGD